MTRLFLVGFTFLSTVICHSQNLVPNPSFEIYSDCPTDHSEYYKATPWTTYRQTPDFFHNCDESSIVSTPLSQTHGYQIPFHGNGQAGFIATTYNTSREFLGVALEAPLEVGEDYYVSFEVSRAFGGTAHSNCNCAVNNLGLKFATQAYSNDNRMPTDNFAHIYSNEVIIDTVAWTQISGWITADSAYTHLGIGNFFENENNTELNLNGFSFLKTYYFVDAVCVASDPIFCNDFKPVSVQYIQVKRELKIYPNPAHSNITIGIDRQIKKIRISNVIGATVAIHSLIGNNNRISIDNLEEGIYILEVIDTENIVYSSIFIKQ